DDCGLPPDISGIYLPGGYPELYAEQLAANSGMKTGIRSAVECGMPVYAECGGYIYLTDGMIADGMSLADFAGIYPVRARMLPKRKALGYRQVELVTDSVVGPAGGVMRGHEFHYSEIGDMSGQIERTYRVSRQNVELAAEGYRYQNCLASYIHLHFGSNPAIAPAFVDSCKAYRAMYGDGGVS
ncbi:MAG: cobyrinic acid a,c-diamide synthase, partial [Verrucomicrobia bacterium]|nr:cobyrinic acid a,c-diamide synthase [Deltaproteobacteria bacterium]